MSDDRPDRSEPDDLTTPVGHPAPPPDVYMPSGQPQGTGEAPFAPPQAPPLPPPAAPPPYPYGQEGPPLGPPPDGRPASTDAVSVTALVLSILGATVIALPLGIWGLTRTGSGARRGRGLAITALGISAVWIIAGIALVASGALNTPSESTTAGAAAGLTASDPPEPVQESPAAPEPTTSPAAQPTAPLAKPTRIYWGDLEPGMCFNFPAASEATDITVVDCRAAHEEEVMANTSLPSPKTWPGDEEMVDPIVQLCRPVFAAYVGIDYDESRLELDWLTADTPGWNDGDHTTICMVFDPAQDQLTRSLRNANE